MELSEVYKPDIKLVAVRRLATRTARMLIPVPAQASSASLGVGSGVEGSFKALILLSLLVVCVELARLGEHALDARRRCQVQPRRSGESTRLPPHPDN